MKNDADGASLDDLLNGQNQGADPGSQPNKQKAGSDSGAQGTEGLPEEVVEFNSLSGSTQDRIVQLARDKRELAEENERLRNQVLSGNRIPTPPPPPTQDDPNVQASVNQLKRITNFTTADEVDQKVNQSLANLRYQFELDRLSNIYNGSDGKPKFTREEYEDYVSRHPQYQNYLPEDVYNQMYREELFDWEMSKRGQQNQIKKTPSLRPTRTAVTPEEELTPEVIEAELQKPGAQEWYAKNLDKINAVLAKQAPTA